MATVRWIWRSEVSTYEISPPFFFFLMFQGSPECQLSIINLLIPGVLKVKSKICGSVDGQGSRREDQEGSERIGEAGGGLGEQEAADKPELHSAEAKCAEGAVMVDIRCLSCSVKLPRLLTTAAKKWTTRHHSASGGESFLFSDAENVPADPVTLTGSNFSFFPLPF